MTQVDWVKEYLQHAFARHIQHGMDDMKKNPNWKLNNECTNWAIGELDEAMEVVNKAIALAQQRTEKKCLERVKYRLETYVWDGNIGDGLAKDGGHDYLIEVMENRKLLTKAVLSDLLK